MVRARTAAPKTGPNRNRVVGEKKMGDFVRSHPGVRGAERGLKRWKSTVESSAFRNFGDVRRAFPSASQVGRRTVFNVRSNHIRLIAQLLYQQRLVVVHVVLTHDEYDRGHWKD
jgi:mRNA interferase HigB